MYPGYRRVSEQRKNKLVKLIDTHCHLYSSKFENDREQAYKDAISQGVAKILLPNIDKESVEGMMKLVADHPQVCFPMVGLHPCSVTENYDAQLDELFSLFRPDEFIAVGETGLDLFWDKTTLDWQRKALIRQLKFAGESGKPVVLHTRSAMIETLAIIKEAAVPNLRGVFHCYSENFELADEIADLGFYFGIGGVITYKNSGLAEAVKNLPLDRIILETDSPYLAPVPFRGKRNEPAYVWHVAKTLGECLGMSINEVAVMTTDNANRLFFGE